MNKVLALFAQPLLPPAQGRDPKQRSFAENVVLSTPHLFSKSRLFNNPGVP